MTKTFRARWWPADGAGLPHHPPLRHERVSAMSNWRIGSKVVCIEDSWIAPHCVANFPRRGEVYVVRGTGDRPILIFANFLASMMGGHPSSGLLLREIN